MYVLYIRPGINAQCFKIQMGNHEIQVTNAEFSKNFASLAILPKDTKSPDEVCQTQKIQMGERTFIPSLLYINNVKASIDQL